MIRSYNCTWVLNSIPMVTVYYGKLLVRKAKKLTAYLTVNAK